MPWYVSSSRRASRPHAGSGSPRERSRRPLAGPFRRVEPAQFAAITRYRDLAQARDVLERHVAAGTLEWTAGGGFRATETGHRFLAELYEHHVTATTELWRGEQSRVERLNGVLQRLLETAAATGGHAFAAMAPAFEPADAAPGLLLLNRLGSLRYHRAGAHAAAWTAAGLTAAQMVALTRVSDREAIEADTNRRDAPPYSVLTPDERMATLADLAALPG